MRPSPTGRSSIAPAGAVFAGRKLWASSEKGQQLVRIKSVLDQREQLAADIQKVQEEIAEVESAVESQTSQVDFETLRDRLRDGMVTHFNRIVQLNPKSWLGNTVSVRLAERSFRLRVGESGWKAKLGVHAALIFSLCLPLCAFEFVEIPRRTLSRIPDDRFPGESRRPRSNCRQGKLHTRTLRRTATKGGDARLRQVIAAGRSFKGLKSVNAIEFDGGLEVDQITIRSTASGTLVYPNTVGDRGSH